VWALNEGVVLDETPPPRSDFQYELVGIVVHMGTAQAGHYYSYCRERGAAGPAKGDRWFCMNDSNTSPWEPTLEQLDEDCFGGKKASTYYVKGAEKETNAFVLFYERAAKAMPSPPPGSPPPAAPGSPAAAALGAGAPAVRVAGANAPALVVLPEDLAPAYTAALLKGLDSRPDAVRRAARVKPPPHLLADILKSNRLFARANYTREEHFNTLLVSVMQNVDAAPWGFFFTNALSPPITEAAAREAAGAGAAFSGALSLLRSISALDRSSTHAAIDGLRKTLEPPPGGRGVSPLERLLAASPSAAQLWLVQQLAPDAGAALAGRSALSLRLFNVTQPLLAANFVNADSREVAAKLWDVNARLLLLVARVLAPLEGAAAEAGALQGPGLLEELCRYLLREALPGVRFKWAASKPTLDLLAELLEGRAGPYVARLLLVEGRALAALSEHVFKPGGPTAAAPLAPPPAAYPGGDATAYQSAPPFLPVPALLGKDDGTTDRQNEAQKMESGGAAPALAFSALARALSAAILAHAPLGGGAGGGGGGGGGG